MVYRHIVMFSTVVCELPHKKLIYGYPNSSSSAAENSTRCLTGAAFPDSRSRNETKSSPMLGSRRPVVTGSKSLAGRASRPIAVLSSLVRPKTSPSRCLAAVWASTAALGEFSSIESTSRSNVAIALHTTRLSTQ